MKALGFGALSRTPSTLLWGIQEPGNILVQELENLGWNPMYFWFLVLYQIQYGHVSFICNQYNGNGYIFFKNGAFIQELNHKAVWKSGKKVMWSRNWETSLSLQCHGLSAGAVTLALWVFCRCCHPAPWVFCRCCHPEPWIVCRYCHPTSWVFCRCRHPAPWVLCRCRHPAPWI